MRANPGSVPLKADQYLNVSVDDLVVVEVPQALQDLPGVEDDGGLFEGTPFRRQQGRQASW